MKKFLPMIQSTTQKVKSSIQKIPPKFRLIILGVILLLILAIVAVSVAMCGRRGRYTTITLVYANWNLGAYRDNALELRMIQSFMDEHPHIIVEIDQQVAMPWTSSLTTAANQGRMPDVFMLEDIGLKAANGWLMDVTSYVWADLDFFDLPAGVQEAMRISGVTYAIPFAQNIHGYFVNRDLLRDMGLAVPAFGVSAEGFLDAVHGATDFDRPSIGLNQAFSFMDWYPSAVDSYLRFFAFDGFGFALNSAAMLEGVRIASELYGGGYTFDGLSDDVIAAYFPSGYALGAFRDGQMAFMYGGTGLAEIMLHQINFDWEFIGVPGGRSIVTLEALGIYSNTSHPEEAYMLARWMGHSAEGSLRRLEYAGSMGIMPTSLPVTQNREVLQELWQLLPVPGLMEIYGSMDRALIDGLRVLPGYMQARFSAPSGIEIDGAPAGIDPLIRYSITGNAYFPDYSFTAERVARQQLDAALAPFR